MTDYTWRIMHLLGGEYLTVWIEWHVKITFVSCQKLVQTKKKKCLFSLEVDESKRKKKNVILTDAKMFFIKNRVTVSLCHVCKYGRLAGWVYYRKI